MLLDLEFSRSVREGTLESARNLLWGLRQHIQKGITEAEEINKSTDDPNIKQTTSSIITEGYELLRNVDCDIEVIDDCFTSTSDSEDDEEDSMLQGNLDDNISIFDLM
ncbi:MAG: hypothetical protein ACRDBG_10365 [Waterburya sp.]